MDTQKNNCKCKKCHNNFVFYDKDTKWKDFGTYSVKLVECPYCKRFVPVKYEDASGLCVNTDQKYYW